MANKRRDPRRFVKSIRDSGLTIYDAIDIGDPALWIPTPDLEALLDRGLRGVSLAGLPLRTRSKVVKQLVCRILGYPTPSTFRKARPRFPGQLFDTYVQKSNNLQIWNEELAPSRRYVLIRVSDGDNVATTKVVTGATLAKLESTGTLTQKFQARFIPGSFPAELATANDTASLLPYVSPRLRLGKEFSPIDQPDTHHLLSIGAVFNRLKKIVGKKSRTPERTRNEIVPPVFTNASARCWAMRNTGTLDVFRTFPIN
ncbi:MAG: hypothetical protein M5R36_11375 [Deltaproteobacteria bacterium]|nr:hypothetical protein [Deltaproteobacteria bacterium]